jgi:hypothetical protein
VVERSRRKREMNDIDTTRIVLTTAVCAAVAALLAVPAQARLLDNDGGGAAVTSEPRAVDRAVAAANEAWDTYRVNAATAAREGVAAAPQPATGERADAALDPAIRAALETRKAVIAAQKEELTAQLTPGAPGTIPYLSHGIGVDESLFSGQQPSVGLNGDSPVTRGEMPQSSATQAVSSTDDLDWTWVGFGGGAALLAAAMGGFYLGTRHRGRIALP